MPDNSQESDPAREITIDDQGNTARVSEGATMVTINGPEAESLGVPRSRALERELRPRSRSVIRVEYRGSAGLEITAVNPTDLADALKRLPKFFATRPNETGIAESRRGNRQSGPKRLASQPPPRQREDMPIDGAFTDESGDVRVNLQADPIKESAEKLVKGRAGHGLIAWVESRAQSVSHESRKDNV